MMPETHGVGPTTWTLILLPVWNHRAPVVLSGYTTRKEAEAAGEIACPRKKISLERYDPVRQEEIEVPVGPWEAFTVLPGPMLLVNGRA